MKLDVLRDLKAKRFWTKFSSQTFGAVGFLAVGMGLYDVLDPDAISKISAPIGPIIVLVALGFGVARSWPRPISETYPSPNTEIRLVVGDLFDRQENLVIGMCDTFDTEIPHIIQSRSVQGQFLSKVYSHDVRALDEDLNRALSHIKPIETVAKVGKNDRFPLGTVATLSQNRRQFYCVAYTEMDEQNRAHGSVDGFWRSLDALWTEVRSKSNGDPVAIPVIGGGQSRLSQILPAQDSIRFIALSFILASRYQRVCSRLDIITHPDDVEKIDMLEIQAFLTSLGPIR